MRGETTQLRSPHPIGETLPALYRDDFFTQQMCDGLDQVIAPAVSVLDNLPAYLDLSTAPRDMLPWLAHWVGLTVDVTQRATRQRRLLRAAIDLQGWLGTRRGIEEALDALFGVDAEVEDSGATDWSTDAGAALPGDTTAAIVVRVRPTDDREVDLDRLDEAVQLLKPAHVQHRVELVSA
jgi:phage tail-like protein